MFDFRGAKFCICRTRQPPTNDDAGIPPEFIGNVAHLGATVHPEKLDTWLFTNSESIDSTASCFVRCTVDTAVPVPTLETLASHDAGQPPLSKSKHKSRDDKSDSNNSKSDTKSRADKSSSADTKTTKHPTPPAGPSTPFDELYLYIELITTIVVRKDVARAGSALKHGKRKKGSVSYKEEIDDDGSGGEKGDDEDKVAEEKVDREVTTVDLSSGWAMIPISASISTTASSPNYTLSTTRDGGKQLSISMVGGTPFSVQSVDCGEVVPRTSTWQAMRRAVGVQVKSSMVIVLSPPVKSTAPKDPAGSNMSFFATSNTVSAFAKLTDFLPKNICVPTSAVMMVGIYRRLLRNSMSKMMYIDPASSKAKSSAVTAVASKDAHLSSGSAGGVKKSTGLSTAAIDPILIHFPKLMEDPAASKVLFYLWEKQMPPAVRGKKNADHAMTEVADNLAVKNFSDIVLRVWRAFGSPIAQKCRLKPVESLEDIRNRENYIRLVVGVEAVAMSKVNANPSAGEGAALSSTVAVAERNKQLVESQDMVYAPFSTKELLWRPSKVI